MDRTQWLLTESQLREWVRSLLDAGNSVVAPVEEDGVLLFRPLTSEERAILAPSGKITNSTD